MRIVVVDERRGDAPYGLREVEGTLALDGLSAGELTERVARMEARERPRWVFTSTESMYPVLLRAGVRVARSHDLTHTEGLLLAADGRQAEPRSPAAAYARATGREPPPDLAPESSDGQPMLFDTRASGLPPGVTVADAAERVLLEQERALAAADALRLLAAAESASALAAAEMSHHGLPWRAEAHHELLTELLGPRVSAGQRPRKLAALAERIALAFDGRPVNPDHAPSVVRAFTRAGIEVPSSRAWVLKDVDHPAVEPLLEYKELARLHSAHGWAWLDRWVSGDRFRPVFVVGGVVSGRWASRGGGALQIPRALRVCVRADPGKRLVVADAAQLEPRVLAALAGDRRLAEVAGADDLYAGLAEDTFDGERSRAKLAMLSAMYGGTAGEAGALLAILRKRFPVAVDYVEHAALAGERGELVRSRLGRTSPPPSERWRELTGRAEHGADGAEHGADGAFTPDGAAGLALRAAREWGRFTRNFVVQASAADWTAVLLALLRARLAEHAAEAELVFFLHDEVIVHCPERLTGVVHEQLEACAAEAVTLVFGPNCPVRFPLHIAAVDCYADAK